MGLASRRLGGARWTTLVALLGVVAAACGGGGSQPPLDADVQAAQNDPPAPTADDFQAVNAAPDGVSVSGPSTFDLVAAAGGGLGPTSPAGVADRSWWARELVLCMRRFAGQAYDTAGTSIHEDCSVAPAPASSTGVMKVWASSAASPGGTQTVVIAFAGTRVTNLGDIVRDLESQAPVPHVNPLDGALPGLPWVGAGWDARWHNQARTLKGVLDRYLADAKAGGKTLDLYLVGHSLGAVTATLAGYDVAQYLRSRAAGLGGHRVQVYAFNPPRLGDGDSRARYQDALFASAAAGACPGGPDRICLLLRQFTRSLDSVQSVPAAMHHPVWSTPSPSPRCEAVVGDGPHDGQPLGYCAQLNLPSLSYWNPLANHHLASWDDQIAQLGDAELIDGMFRVNGT